MEWRCEGLQILSTPHYMPMMSFVPTLFMKPNTSISLRPYGIAKHWQPLYFTLDAGANVHLLYPKSHKDVILEFMDSDLRTFCKDGYYVMKLVKD